MRIRVVAARLCVVFIHIQLFVTSCQNRLTEFLLSIPTMLPPKTVPVDGDLAGMARNVEQGTKIAQSSPPTIAQFIDVILFLGGLTGLRKVGKQGGMGLAGYIVSIIIGAVLVAGPEMINRSQKQLGISSISIG